MRLLRSLVTLSPAERERAIARARAAGVSLAAWLRRVIERELDDPRQTGG